MDYVSYTAGAFMKVLLETLGYNVHFISCMIKKPNDHICTVVRDLSYEGSEHLIDITGYPNFETVPLDFTETSSVYKHSFSWLLTLGAHAQEGYGTCPVCLFVCLSVCLSVCYHLIVDIVRFYGLPKVRAALF